MSHITTIVFTGKGGTPYRFDTHCFKNNLGHIPGVYIFVKREKKSDGAGYVQKPIYIGQTEDFQERMQDHEKWNCVLEHGATHISFMDVRDPIARLAIETDLRKAYPTPCNEQ